MLQQRAGAREPGPGPPQFRGLFDGASLSSRRRRTWPHHPRPALAMGRDADAERLIANAKQRGVAESIPALLYPCHQLYALLADA